MKLLCTTCIAFLMAIVSTQAQTVLLETFDNSSVPAGWSNVATSGPGWIFSTSAGYDVSSTLDHTGNGGNYAWIDFSGTDANVRLTSPVIDVSSLTTPLLKFYYESHYTGTLTPFNFLFIEAWNGATWINVNTFQGNTPFGWDEININVSAFTYSNGDSLRIRFRGESGGAGNDFNNDLLIDDVEVMELPSCPSPNTLSAANITTNTADISWTEVGTATNWELEWGALGFQQGTGTVVPTTTNPHTLTGLPPSSTLQVYVRSVCAPGDTSTWSAPLTITTACAVVMAPWIESFNQSATPNCWNETGSEPWRYTTTGLTGAAATAGDHTGNGGNFAWIDGSFPSGATQISSLETPFVDVSGLNVPLLSFWVFSHNPNDNTYNTLITEIYDGAAWIAVDTINTDQGNAWTNVAIGLQGLTITGPVQARFTVIEDGASFFNDIIIDDIEFKDAPNVAATELLDVQNIYCNSAVNVRLVVENRSGNIETDVPWVIESDGMVIAGGSIAMLTPNGRDTIPVSLGGVGPAGPNAAIIAYTDLAPDQTPSDDTLVTTVGMSYTGVSATVSNPVGCAGAANGSISAMGNSGIGMYSYLWDANANNQTTAMAMNLAAGTYTVTVTDSIGCAVTATLSLTDPAVMSVSSIGTDLGCNGDNSGMASTTVAGGVPGYSYLWSNGQTSAQLMNAAAGTYTVTVTDSYGCEVTSSVTLAEPTAVVAMVMDNGNGTATATASGGAAPYTYQWDPNANNQTTATATGLIAGEVYYVVVTDANGCTDVFSFQAIVLSNTNLAAGEQVNLYPNPTAGNAFLEVNLEETTDVMVQITTVTGQLVNTQRLGQLQTNTIELETSDLTNGVYLIEIHLGDRQLTQKLIVNK